MSDEERPKPQDPLSDVELGLLSAKEQRLSHGALCDLTHRFDVEPSTVKREEIARLFAEYVACVDAGDPIPDRLTRWVRDRFYAFLQKQHPTLDRVFHLIPRPGMPSADDDDEFRIAVSVLEARMSGVPHQTTLEQVAEQFHCGESTVGKAWRRKRKDAADWWALSRAEEGNGLDVAERKKLEELKELAE